MALFNTGTVTSFDRYDNFQTVAFKSYLLSLGVSDPVTKSAFVGSDSEYFMKLAEELTNVLAEPLKVTNLLYLFFNFIKK